MIFGRIACCSLLLLAWVTTWAQESAVTTVSLDEFSLHASRLQHAQTRKAAVDDVTIRFQPDQSQRFDSSFFLTEFSSLSSKAIRLASIRGRVAAFDTAGIRLYFAVLQFRHGDTLFTTLPIGSGDISDRGQFELRLSDYGITLQPGPFFLGYGFRVMFIAAAYDYPLYTSVKGDGLQLAIRNGAVSYVKRPSLGTFPFSLTYFER